MPLREIQVADDQVVEAFAAPEGGARVMPGAEVAGLIDGEVQGLEREVEGAIAALQSMCAVLDEYNPDLRRAVEEEIIEPLRGELQFIVGEIGDDEIGKVRDAAAAVMPGAFLSEGSLDYRAVEKVLVLKKVIETITGLKGKRAANDQQIQDSLQRATTGYRPIATSLRRGGLTPSPALSATLVADPARWEEVVAGLRSLQSGGTMYGGSTDTKLTTEMIAAIGEADAERAKVRGIDVEGLRGEILSLVGQNASIDELLEFLRQDDIDLQKIYEEAARLGLCNIDLDIEDLGGLLQAFSVVKRKVEAIVPRALRPAAPKQTNSSPPWSLRGMPRWQKALMFAVISIVGGFTLFKACPPEKVFGKANNPAQVEKQSNVRDIAEQIRDYIRANPRDFNEQSAIAAARKLHVNYDMLKRIEQIRPEAMEGERLPVTDEDIEGSKELLEALEVRNEHFGPNFDAWLETILEGTGWELEGYAFDTTKGQGEPVLSVFVEDQAGKMTMIKIVFRSPRYREMEIIEASTQSLEFEDIMVIRTYFYKIGEGEVILPPDLSDPAMANNVPLR